MAGRQAGSGGTQVPAPLDTEGKRHHYETVRIYAERGGEVPNAEELLYAYAIAAERNDTALMRVCERAWFYHVNLKG